jgi:bla regulator protein BlaR1
MMTPSWINALANHLWQSTVFAIVISLVAVAFRRYQARVRYALWLSASLKFLVPVSLLIGLGTHLSTPARASSEILSTVRQVSVPFDAATVLAPASSVPTSSSAVGPIAIVFGIWVCGVLAIAGMRWRAWRHLKALVNVATGWSKLGLALPPHVDVRSVSGMTEPGVLGFIRPIILLPSGIDVYLNRDQLDAVLAHELCHIDRCDNVTAAFHMLVEAVFWFHPVVWWIGARLIHERERACDEHVLATCGEPEAYAEGILNVCRHYVGAPLPCMAGVSGSDLKERIKAIVANRIGRRLSVMARLMLVLLGIAAIGVPLIVGAQAPPARPEFEVASIKPTKFAPGLIGVQFLPGGRIHVAQAPVSLLITAAYHISAQQIEWPKPLPPMLETFYNIDAKAPSSATSQGTPDPVARQQLVLMLQSLLADRFKLRLHHETKELAVLALLVAKNGPTLVKAADRDCTEAPSIPNPCHVFPGGPARGAVAKMVTMSDLADYLSLFMQRLVVDRTSIRGNFDIELPPWSRGTEVTARAADAGLEPAPDPSSPSIFAVLQDRLGLRLESSKSQMDVLVIDHVEKPSED